MDINGAFPSDYLKAADIPPGRQIGVTIQSVEIEQIGKNKESRPIVYFQGKDKGLVLNKTNAKKITAIVGSPETANWSGRQIALYRTTVEFSGEQVEAIRVDYPTQGKQPEPPPPVSAPDVAWDDSEDWPF